MSLVQGYSSDEDDGRNRDTSSVSTYSTNATADDLPGPGRLLDKYIYQHGGRIIERFVMRWTMANLHPSHIVRYLSPSPASCKYVLSASYENDIFKVENIHGLTVVTGLKSLVEQTQ